MTDFDAGAIGSIKEMFPNLNKDAQQKAEFLKFSRKVSDRRMREIIMECSDDPETLDYLVRHSIHMDERIFQLLACRNLKEETVRWIFQRYHGVGAINTASATISPELEGVRIRIRQMIAVHPHAPMEIIDAFLQEECFSSEAMLIRSKAFSLPFTEKKETDSSLLLAQANYLDIQTVETLMVHGTHEVKLALYANIHLPVEAYATLAHTNDTELLGLLAENAGFPYKR
jgi:hypothetical protein